MVNGIVGFVVEVNCGGGGVVCAFQQVAAMNPPAAI